MVKLAANTRDQCKEAKVNDTDLSVPYGWFLSKKGLDTYSINIVVRSRVVLQLSQTNFERGLRDVFNPHTCSVTLQSGTIVRDGDKH